MVYFSFKRLTAGTRVLIDLLAIIIYTDLGYFRRGGTSMAKLWQKEYTLDALMEEFTVGNDYLLDANLVESRPPISRGT
jgi:hypothetical protein